ncbi:hypothetical protein LIER_33267 [Lithospermum erythrorhizon]|uniref:Uncharacterized protein n=1 Tax=Lithospermum erythrorhizon TaxID=34254 RepID=A0AAV3RX48_LITER
MMWWLNNKLPRTKWLPKNDQPTISNEWLPENDQPVGAAEENTQGLDDEDITAITIKRRKVKGKLKTNENKSRVGNKTVSKNVAVVSIENVALNSVEEVAKCKFFSQSKDCC